jgi:hypothetical protein
MNATDDYFKHHDFCNMEWIPINLRISECAGGVDCAGAKTPKIAISHPQAPTSRRPSTTISLPIPIVWNEKDLINIKVSLYKVCTRS